MTARVQKPRDPATLKDAASALVTRCGGIELAGKIARKSPAQMHRYTDPACDDVYMPGDVKRALELHCGDPIVTRFEALEMDCMLVSIRHGQSRNYMRHLASIGSATGKLYKRMCDAIADGRVDRSEAMRVRAELLLGVTAMAALYSDLNRHIGADDE